jgi:acyl-coenzyme A thioesterase PaaI-like protein
MNATPAHLDPLETFGPESPCFGCSPTHPLGLHMRFAREGDEITTRIVVPDGYQGPPGVVHGGIVMTIADELAAWTIIGLRERFGFTGAISSRLLRPVRPGVELFGRGRIVRDGSRVLKIEVVLSQEDQEAFRGEFTFVLLDEAGAEKLLGGPVAAQWKRFCR